MPSIFNDMKNNLYLNVNDIIHKEHLFSLELNMSYPIILIWLPDNQNIDKNCIKHGIDIKWYLNKYQILLDLKIAKYEYNILLILFRSSDIQIKKYSN